MSKKCISGLKNIEEFSNLLQLISDPLRIQILCYLGKLPDNQGCYVCDLKNVFNKASNLISHHLGMLKRAQLVTSSKEGTRRRYQLNMGTYERLKTKLSIVFDL